MFTRQHWASRGKIYDMKQLEEHFVRAGGSSGVHASFMLAVGDADFDKAAIGRITKRTFNDDWVLPEATSWKEELKKVPFWKVPSGAKLKNGKTMEAYVDNEDF